MLAFSNVISQYGNYLRENEPVVITGRLSLRDDKEPQIVINRARPMSDFTDRSGAVEVTEPKKLSGTLYLRLPSETAPADYRHLLKGTHVVPIGALMDEESAYQDDQIVSIAGIVQVVKMKTTRNNSMMSYVTVEDDTASIEMLAFSNVLNQYGGYLKENQPVVIVGRLSMRDDKEPQIIVNRARPMSDFANQPSEEMPTREAPKTGTLYLRLPSDAVVFKCISQFIRPICKAYAVLPSLRALC